jgi:hypothetical protein
VDASVYWVGGFQIALFLSSMAVRYSQLTAIETGRGGNLSTAVAYSVG